MIPLLFPDPTRNRRLLHDLNDLFSAMLCVQRIIVFGSFAREEADRWSDIDMIVVTAKQEQFLDVLAKLTQHKPILVRGHLALHAEASGSHILGIVFEGESIFHNVDLNFLTADEYHTPDALNRFGTLKEVYATATPVSEIENSVISVMEVEHLDHSRIYLAAHFTKKAIKKVLRGQAAYDELRQRLDKLRLVMSEYPPEVVTQYGKIGWLAHQYLTMAEMVLHQQIDS